VGVLPHWPKSTNGPDPAGPPICAALHQIPEIILALAQPDLGKREHCPTVPRAAMVRIRLGHYHTTQLLVCKCYFVFGVAVTVARSLGPIVLYIKY
jgi:hypothetical protein